MKQPRGILTPRERQIFEWIAANEGRPVSTRELLQVFYGGIGDSAAIRTHVANTRKKVGDVIHSWYNLGYWVYPVDAKRVRQQEREAGR